MKTIPVLSVLSMLCTLPAWSQASNFTNFIRQVQYPGGIVWDMSVAQSGETFSALPIDPGGARFELWTVNSVGPSSHLLSSSYVGTYIPVASVTVSTEDQTSTFVRTRADRPYTVSYSVSGLRSGADDPEASKRVNFFWHVQSYGVDGTGENIDRSQATLIGAATLRNDMTGSFTIPMTMIPGADRAKIRGEERFSIYSLEDYQAPASELSGQALQIWPVADGAIAGVEPGELVRYKVPQLTLTFNDLYPFSTTYAQAYKGSSNLGTVGKILPGSALVVDDSVPQSRVLVIQDYGESLEEDGVWTVEILTQTPFGIDRLAYVTFNLDRSLKVRGTFSTIE